MAQRRRSSSRSRNRGGSQPSKYSHLPVVFAGIFVLPIAAIYGLPAVFGLWILLVSFTIAYPNPQQTMQQTGAVPEEENRAFMIAQDKFQRYADLGRRLTLRPPADERAVGRIQRLAWVGVAYGWKQNRKGEQNPVPERFFGRWPDIKTVVPYWVTMSALAALLPVNLWWFRVLNAASMWVILASFEINFRFRTQRPAGTFADASVVTVGKKEPGRARQMFAKVTRTEPKPSTSIEVDWPAALQVLTWAAAGAIVGVLIVAPLSLSFDWGFVRKYTDGTSFDFLGSWLVPLPVSWLVRVGLVILVGLSIALNRWGKIATEQKFAAESEQQADRQEWMNLWLGAGVKPEEIPSVSKTVREFTTDDGSRVVAVRRTFAVGEGRSPSAFIDLGEAIRSAKVVQFAEVFYKPEPRPPGGRNPIGFEVVYETSKGAIPPEPHLDPKCPTSIQSVAVTSAMNRAFRAAKLELPQMMSSELLTEKGKKPVYRTRWRLYGNVNLTAVLAKQSVIEQALRARWLVVEQGSDVPRRRPGDTERPTPQLDPSSIYIYFGAVTPIEAEWASQVRGIGDKAAVQSMVEDVSWSNAFRVAGLARDGRTPHMLRFTEGQGNVKVNSAVFVVPPGLTVTDVRDPKAQRELQGATSKAYMKILPVLGEVNQFEVLYSDSDPVPNLVMLDDFLQQCDDASEGEEMYLPIGLSAERADENGLTFGDMAKTPHFMVTGATGSGKSVLMQAMIQRAVRRRWKVHLCDPKQTEFGVWDGYVDSLAIGTEECWRRVAVAFKEMEDRNALMMKFNVRHWSDLEKIRQGQDPSDPDYLGDEPIVPVLTVVDELMTFMSTMNNHPDKDERKEMDEVKALGMSALFQVARLGRAAGFHLIVAMQRASATGAGFYDFRNNVRGRALLGAVDDKATDMMFGVKGIKMPGQRGRGLFMQEGMSDPIEVQTYFIPDLEEFFGKHLDESYRKETAKSVLDGGNVSMTAADLGLPELTLEQMDWQDVEPAGGSKQGYVPPSEDLFGGGPTTQPDVYVPPSEVRPEVAAQTQPDVYVPPSEVRPEVAAQTQPNVTTEDLFAPIDPPAATEHPDVSEEEEHDPVAEFKFEL